MASAGGAIAAEADAVDAAGSSRAAPTQLDAMLVTGTRASNRTQFETLAPVDVFTKEDIKSVESTDLKDVLAQLGFQRDAPPFLFGFGHVVGQVPRGIGQGPRGILGHADHVGIDPAHESQRFRELRGGFAGKADDDVGGESHARKSGADAGDGFPLSVLRYSFRTLLLIDKFIDLCYTEKSDGCCFVQRFCWHRATTTKRMATAETALPYRLRR